jgi:predicted unusual protein kinase regulating ubiquinone biosynthesis (AarF/ABC1/UbiB family)
MDCLKLGWIFLTECARYLWHRDTDRCVCNCLLRAIRVNLIFTKLLQGFASKNPDMLRHVHAVPIADDCPPPQLPDLQCAERIGAGLTAVVYDATFKGQPCVVKVKRPNIRERIRHGLSISQWLLRALVCFFQNSELASLHYEVSNVLLEQCNFDVEVENQRKYALQSTLVVPKILHHEETFIVMEKLSGTSLSALSAEQKEKYASILCKNAMESALVHGFIHADMHVGNIFFMDGNIGLIDFGLMAVLAEREQDAYTYIMQSLKEHNFKTAASVAMRHIIEPADVLKTLTSEETVQLQGQFEVIFQNAMADNKAFGLNDILKITTIITPYGLHVAQSFYKMVVVLSAFEFLLKELTKNSATLLTSHVH